MGGGGLVGVQVCSTWPGAAGPGLWRVEGPRARPDLWPSVRRCRSWCHLPPEPECRGTQGAGRSRGPLASGRAAHVYLPWRPDPGHTPLTWASSSMKWGRRAWRLCVSSIREHIRMCGERPPLAAPGSAVMTEAGRCLPPPCAAAPAQGPWDHLQIPKTVLGQEGNHAGSVVITASQPGSLPTIWGLPCPCGFPLPWPLWALPHVHAALESTPGDSKPGLQQKEAPMVGGEARLGASAAPSLLTLGLLGKCNFLGGHCPPCSRSDPSEAHATIFHCH